jgi:hypothetical protein
MPALRGVNGRFRETGPTGRVDSRHRVSAITVLIGATRHYRCLNRVGSGSSDSL